jgi:hypothetical protein
VTAADVLLLAKNAGILFEVAGDQLIIDAPVGAVTAELRDTLARHKPELLTILAPVTEFVYLRSGLTVPRPAYDLAGALQARDFRLVTDPDHQFTIEPTATSGPLTEQDRAGISRWRPHLGAIVGYRCPELA